SWFCRGALQPGARIDPPGKTRGGFWPVYGSAAATAEQRGGACEPRGRFGEDASLRRSGASFPRGVALDSRGRAGPEIPRASRARGGAMRSAKAGRRVGTAIPEIILGNPLSRLLKQSEHR